MTELTCQSKLKPRAGARRSFAHVTVEPERNIFGVGHVVCDTKVAACFKEDITDQAVARVVDSGKQVMECVVVQVAKAGE